MKQLTTKLLACFFISMLSSCSNDDEKKTVAQTTSQTVLYDNVKIISSDTMVLDITPALINAGTYKFTFTGNQPVIIEGDIIVGNQGEGFIRKVTSVVVEGDILVLQTTQGSMANVFKKGRFNFNVGMNDMTQNRAASEDGFSYTINNFTLYNQGPLSVILNSGQISLNPNWHFDFDFNEDGLQLFEMSANAATLQGNFAATVSAQQAVSASYSSSLFANDEPYTKSYTAWVPALLLGVPVEVPVTIVVEMDLIADVSANISAAVSRQATFNTNNTFDLGLKYSDDQWQGIYNFNTQNSYLQNQSSGQTGFAVNLGLTPKISAKLYGIAGPNASIGLREELKGNIASPALDWDFKADVWLKTKLGAQAGFSILDQSIATSYEHTWETDRLSYITPYKLQNISGSNQVGQQGVALPQPIKILVVDNLDHPQKNVPVYFTVIGGGGSVNPQSILTDAQGYAQTTWTLGNQIGHELQVIVKKADGTGIINSPLAFYASNSGCQNTTLNVTVTANGNDAIAVASGGQPPYTYAWSNGFGGAVVGNLVNGNYTVTVIDAFGCNATGYVSINDTSACGDSTTLTDIDGNTYNIVSIGSQCWTQRNLDVSHYRNGDVIPQVTNAIAWSHLTSGAWCYYENITDNGTIYGKLYNWFAVNDPRGLAPAGWHIPNDTEWTTLGNYLGGSGIAGGKMKSTVGWDPPNSGATNESGFTGLPGGFCNNGGAISVSLGYDGDWWTSSEYGTDSAWSRSLYSTSSYLASQNYYEKVNGFSVRCVRD